MIFRALFSLWMFASLLACSGTTVVLVPDANGKVGQVDLTTKAGTTSLSKANESAKAPKANEAPSDAVELSDKEIKDMFAKTLAKEPAPPVHFTFYFATGSALISPASKDQLAKTKSAIDTRKSCDISVIGHSDTVGDNPLNEGISLQRAESVITALVELGVDKNCMDKRYYGENDLAIPTEDNIDEPRNRRVEAEVR